MSQNAFVLPTNEYKRDMNIIGHYYSDAAYFLNKMTGQPLEVCAAYVREVTAPGAKLAMVDPQMKMLVRGENGDRVKKLDTLTGYLKKVNDNKEIFTGTFTTYTHPDQKKSLIVDFIDANIKARSLAKKAKFLAMGQGNKLLEKIKDIEQTGKKLSNNAMSGAHASGSTPLFNRTGHSSLTSNCRTTSGYGNANNEKFLAGNRHYWAPEIVMNNIVSIVNHSDYDAIMNAMDKFGIRHPTIEETMECIQYSTQLYWRNAEKMNSIYMLVCRLTPVERAAFVYTGDFYHLMKLNPEVVREFLRKISQRIDVVHPNPGAVKKSSEEACQLYACLLCSDYLRGTNLKDIEGTPEYGYYGSTLDNVNNVINEYFDFIRAFMVTVNVPASVANFPTSVRRVVLTSDTDSTIFTVQDWVQWYCGEIVFNKESNAVSDAVVFISSQSITHILARMSANFGIVQERMHQIAMKNEFKFDVFVPTQVGKHYFAVMSSQEGLIFAKLKKEIKGVHLKSSNVPREIIKRAEKMMLFIMDEVMAGRKIVLKDILKEIGDVERDIMAAIRSGKHNYFRKTQIKNAETYAKGADTPNYKQYLMWNEVMGPKFGTVGAPPYVAIKVPVKLNKPLLTTEWLEGLEDQELANRFRTYMAKNMRKHIAGTIFVPEQCVNTHGIPLDIIEAIGVRELISDTVSVFYIILEALGVYMLNDKVTRLVSDTY